MSARLINFVKSAAVYGVAAGVVSAIYLLAIAAASPDSERTTYYPALNRAEFDRIMSEGRNDPEVGPSTVAALPQEP